VKLLTEATVLDLSKNALFTIILVSGPMLGFGLVVGLIVSIFQAATQIQEQTLTFIPKILAILLSGLLFGPWMLRVLMDFASKLLGNMHTYIR
jgi:flagellar biosynthetic protein FliQ